MEFTRSTRSLELGEELSAFIADHVVPAEAAVTVARAERPDEQPELVEELKARARSLGLWNLSVRDPYHGPGLSFVDYAPLAEMMGPHRLAQEATNCDAPSNINVDAMIIYGSADQKERWLEPQLDGRIRSAFSMTEPAVASSDAANIAMTAVPESGVPGGTGDDDTWVLNGRKWYVSGVLHPNCRYLMTVANTDDAAGSHGRHTQFIVPMDAEGLTVVRNLPKFGYLDDDGHVELEYDNVRVPGHQILGEVGDGFAIGQARLGPARVQHCMRMIGVAEVALTMMCQRAEQRTTFGAQLSSRANVMDWIAEARIEIEAARLLTLRTAWLMDTEGDKAAAPHMSLIKVHVMRMVTVVLDRAIQVFGAAGVSDDTPLARWYATMRALRIADGPDEVHLMAIGTARAAASEPADVVSLAEGSGRDPHAFIDVDRLVARTSELIALPSVNPFVDGSGALEGDDGIHGEGRVAAWLRGHLEGLGYEVEVTEPAAGRPNIVGTSSGGGPVVVLAGHTDTVGVTDTTVPYEPVLRDGRLHGRGACDMKGALAAFIEVAEVLAEAGVELSGRLRIAGVADEEHGMIGSAAMGASGPIGDHVIVGEPTQMAVCTSHKGQYAFGVRTLGRAAHSSIPETGVNAVEHMAEIVAVVAGLRAELAQRPPHPMCGVATIIPSVIDGGDMVAIVPDRCDLAVDRRLLPGETGADAAVELAQRIDAVAAGRPDFAWEMLPAAIDAAPLSTPVDAPVVIAAIEAMAARGGWIEPSPFSGATDAPNLGGSAIIWGPGSLEQAHTVDEWIAVSELELAAHAYLDAVLSLIGPRQVGPEQP